MIPQPQWAIKACLLKSHAESGSSRSLSENESFNASDEYREKIRKAACEAGTTEEDAKNLLDTLPSLDSVIRIHDSLTALPDELSCALRNRLHLGYDPESGMISLLHRVTYHEMNRRIAETPLLLSVDGEQLDACQRRYLLLTEQKRQIVIDYIRQKWYSLQKEHLLLLRGKRVVIAGDPKQLPPSRFFETAVVESGNVDGETEQELFEAQQGDVEDILSGALNLDVDQSYLDVHYRSRCAGLIEFSNQSFYESRLQPIPGHPRNRAMMPPIRLLQVNGVYSKRTNRTEAEEVVRIIKELLKRSEPPSIGVACFNLSQRELILDLIDNEANTDEDFAVRLKEARSRRGKDSFEGLFVKNLENVQGDERDVIIISTTFGPDPNGKFYRRFGPLGMTGGGRRLYVLVTRSRQEIIIVTSIPPSAYRTPAPLPDGKQPNGAWFLFSYLRYAELLQKLFEEDWNKRKEALTAKRGEVKMGDSEYPSLFCEALAGFLARNFQISSEVYWGSDGFCIDLALLHPVIPNDVTVGVLCDGTRFGKAPDAAEWDAFRTIVLASQGWDIHRIWTPHFLRYPDKEFKRLQKSIEAVLNPAKTEVPEKQVYSDN